MTPARVRGKHGNELRFAAADVDTLRSHYTRPRAGAAGTTALIAADVLREQLERLQVERDDLYARAVRADVERERAERAEAALAVAQERVEALKALGAWDRLRGRHKRI